MAINIAVKNWLAQNAGSSNCFASSGIAYRDPDGVGHTGGTGDVLNAFYVAHLVGLDTAIIIASTNYNGIKATNGNADIILADVTWAYNNDGAPAGEPRYCVTATPTPTPSPAGPPAGVVTLCGEQVGEPQVELGVLSVDMKQSMVDYHFEINKLGLRLTSGSQCPCVVAVLIKLFSGERASCPGSGEVFYGADRESQFAEQLFAGPARPGDIRMRILQPDETYSFSTDYYQPMTITGVHTVCIYIYANWTEEMLKAELAAVPGLQ